jgi:glycine/serine hydroxymethyltransferase
MEQIADWIHTVLTDTKNEAKKKEVREEIRELCKRFPFYL